ncbi:MAG: hypothetical protein ACD_36C00132G0001 [uncultured bacterium]|nr:MAG: hypothetical protein ACD_36C00132G0001 [uncultured bacterium]
MHKIKKYADKRTAYNNTVEVIRFYISEYRKFLIKNFIEYRREKAAQWGVITDG